MNCRKEGVGITQLCRADQWPPSSGIGGRTSRWDGKEYIWRKAASKAVLHALRSQKQLNIKHISLSCNKIFTSKQMLIIWESNDND